MSIELGDVVRLDCMTGEYSTCTVEVVHSDGTVDLFRPYTHTADFSMGGKDPGDSKVICYVGVEHITRVSPKHVVLLRKSHPLK